MAQPDRAASAEGHPGLSAHSADGSARSDPSSPARLPRGGPRYDYVDLIRGLCAFSVLIVHYRWFFARTLDDWVPEAVAHLPAYGALWPIYEHGGLAVQMFWVLSGFVFAIAYGRFGRALNLRQFWAYRFARLYPLHLATLLAIAGIQIVGYHLYGHELIYGNNDLPHFIRHIFLASNWFSQENSFNGPIWSVSVEIVIYLAFLIYMKGAGLNLPLAALIAIAFAILERLSHNLIAWCGALFFIGVVIAIVAPLAQARIGKWTIAVGMAGCLVTFGGIATLVAAGRSANVPTLFVYLGMPAILFTLASFDHSFKGVPRSLRWIGAITYAVYLLHMPLVIGAKTAFPVLFGDYDFLRSPLVLLAYAASVIGLGVIVHYSFELPMQTHFRRTLSKRPLPPASAKLEQDAI